MAKWQEERVRWKTPQMVKLLSQSWDLRGNELGVFLRMHGLTTHDIKTWKETLKAALDSEKPVNPSTKKYYDDKIKRLEKELQEAREINDAQKKVQRILASAAASNTAKKSGKKSSTSSKKKQRSKA